MNSNIHDDHVRIIGLKPGLIGLSNIVLSCSENNVFNEDRLFRQPDNLLFNYKTKTIYNIEYKCNNMPSRRNHAIDQLKTSEQKLHNIFYGWRTVNLYISEDYKVEKIN